MRVKGGNSPKKNKNWKFLGDKNFVGEVSFVVSENGLPNVGWSNQGIGVTENKRGTSCRKETSPIMFDREILVRGFNGIQNRTNRGTKATGNAHRVTGQHILKFSTLTRDKFVSLKMLGQL